MSKKITGIRPKSSSKDNVKKSKPTDEELNTLAEEEEVETAPAGKGEVPVVPDLSEERMEPEVAPTGRVLSVDDEVEEARLRPRSKNDMRKIALVKDIDPCPTIGTFDFRREMGISVLKKGKYAVPQSVAEVLVDKGAAYYID